MCFASSGTSAERDLRSMRSRPMSSPRVILYFVQWKTCRLYCSPDRRSLLPFEPNGGSRSKHVALREKFCVNAHLSVVRVCYVVACFPAEPEGALAASRFPHTPPVLGAFSVLCKAKCSRSFKRQRTPRARNQYTCRGPIGLRSTTTPRREKKMFGTTGLTKQRLQNDVPPAPLYL